MESSPPTWRSVEQQRDNLEPFSEEEIEEIVARVEERRRQARPWKRGWWAMQDFFSHTRTGKVLTAIGAALAILLAWAWLTAIAGVLLAVHAYVFWVTWFGWPEWTIWVNVSLAPIIGALILWKDPNEWGTPAGPYSYEPPRKRRRQSRLKRSG